MRLVGRRRCCINLHEGGPRLRASGDLCKNAPDRPQEVYSCIGPWPICSALNLLAKREGSLDQ